MCKYMGLFGLTRKKDKRGATMSDEQRELSLQSRRLNAEFKRKQQELEMLKLERKQQIEEMKLERERLRLEEELSELRGEYDEENGEEDSMEKMLLMQFLGNMNKSQEQPVQQQPQQTNFEGASLSDEAIDQALNSFPKTVLKKFKGFSDEQLGELIKTRIGPYATQETINRIIAKYREKFK